ncbi:hypothetical protein LO771_09020 [Streptacidiphilus sp. ASG 303]|uniref:hypothetical protein n=1 Tax=Streptacidiphilus sp. ASG 303 TaxID=2896847 RepID=UPI001E626D52|nr:hypothetical protein [Streptacidiphilus sp. ASG 303]MCD0482539.1 hypothetical protein [Streptacidiphilus sp. ASG 303]
MDATHPAPPGPAPLVLLVGGCSGIGKTSIARALAAAYSMPLVEVDDVVEALLVMTTPEQQPDLHHWRTRPEDACGPPGRIAEVQLRTARALAPALAAVAANHVATGTPVVVEGDYLLPSLASPAGPVRGVVVHEDDEDGLVANYLAREPDAGPQRHRARASLAYGRLLAAEAAAAGVPVLSPRPWHDAPARTAAALGLPPLHLSDAP